MLPRTFPDAAEFVASNDALPGESDFDSPEVIELKRIYAEFFELLELQCARYYAGRALRYSVYANLKISGDHQS